MLKGFLCSDRSLQLDFLKKESPVIVRQLITVKLRLLPGVLTARHVRRMYCAGKVAKKCTLEANQQVWIKTEFL